jgi:uroporphyrinogen III methyltransferase/synthase
MSGFVSIVGAGPWDPELLTLAGRERLARADVVVVDYLVNPALLMHCRPGVEVLQRIEGPHEGPRLDQAEINALMVDRARAGRFVVRLKGGDPMVFGRGAEEAAHLRAHGIAFEVVPGVSAALAAPATAGIPITHRDHTPAFCVVSGYEAYEKAGLRVEWEHLAKSAGTLVLLMSVKNCAENARRLMAAGRAPQTPAAVVRWGTRGIQKTVVGTLATIGDEVERADIRPPAVMIVGDVVSRRDEIEWFERRPLFGRRVVVTRAPPQSGRLLHLLAQQGADAVAFPCLEFAPPLDPAALRGAIDRLDAFDGVVLSSPAGVDAFLHALLASGRDVRRLARHQVAAIGTGTAERALAAGLRPDVVPSIARSEGLRDLLEQRGRLAARWLHVRADEGRDVLADAIRRAGGHIEIVVGYRTIRPEVPPLLLRSLLPPDRGGEGFDAVCFASGKAGRHFLETLKAAHGADPTREIVQAARVVALGPVTAEALRALGVRVDAVADEPTDEGMATAVRRALGHG